ncbi:MAG: response regulator [Candidatus Lokiarchaeota archaeon]|nr:response regulator [Candidatus Lokiarchaeota archaeon]
MRSVFIVEDDKSIQLLYQKYLNLYGYVVLDIANNGIEAIDKFKLFIKKPDIIIMDHRMPLKDGLSATKEILRLDKKSNIIFASADRSIKNEALSIGIKGFLEKPFNLDNLIKHINKTIKKE